MTKRKYCYEFTKYRQYKCCICGRTMHEPTPHICNGQYRKHNLEFYNKIMENQITIQKENVLNAYNQASEEQKALLENMFGKDMFQTKDIKERVKTFDDAVEILGNDNQAVIDYYAIADKTCTKDILAYAKLRVITEALNEGWKPTFIKDERSYFPWFQRYTKEQYNELDDKKKRYCVLRSSNCGDLYYSYNFVFCFAYFDASFSSTGCGSQLAFKTKELAEYCGKQFIDIWADYLFA